MNALVQFIRSTRGRVLVESAIVLAIFISAANWGTWYWNQSFAMGRHPFFYQLYYEPAVMVACGKGFVVAQPQVPAMTKFLQEQVETFNCADIPAGVKLGRDGLFQGASRYLMTSVGWAWRIFGVSWRRLGPVAGVLFGVTIAAAYGIFRLGMGRVLALVMSWMLSLSTLHLGNLPHIRDYSKAPFALLLIFLLGLLVTRRPAWPRVLGVAAACGLVCGAGYGFRTDLAINIPAVLLTLFLFLDARLRERLMYGAAASIVFFGVFYATAWPVLSMINDTSRCQWHIAALGLGDDPTRELGLSATPYDWVDGFTDEFVYATTTSHAARVRPGVKHIEYCSADYDDATRGWALDIVRQTPADFIVRAYASSLQMVQLPFRWRKPPMPHVAVDFYKIRLVLTSHAADAGIVLVALATWLVMASSIRLGLFLLGFLLYFGGYPAVQFGNRHFFHLEFITWWALGFLLQQIVVWGRAKFRGRPSPAPSLHALGRSATVLAAVYAALFSLLWMARWYQESTLEPLMQRYVRAQVDQVMTEEGPGNLQRVPAASAKTTDPETADLLEVVLDESACPAESTLKFVYPPSHIGFARDVEIRRTTGRTPTRIFLPVFATFAGVTIGKPAQGCIAGVYRVQHPEQFRLMPKVTLRPGWEHQPLYQTLIGWGIEPPPDE